MHEGMHACMYVCACGEGERGGGEEGGWVVVVWEGWERREEGRGSM